MWECPKCGGSWGEDETCPNCTYPDFSPRPLNDPGIGTCHECGIGFFTYTSEHCRDGLDLPLGHVPTPGDKYPYPAESN